MTESILGHLTEALDKLYNQRRQGIHVSDVTMCPRKAIFRRLNPSKTTPTELNFFTLGKSLHQAAQDLTEVFPQYTQEMEVWLTKKGQTEFVYSKKEDFDDEEDYREYLQMRGIDPDNDLVAHIDLYNKQENIPIEMKGIRKASIDAPKDFHIQQLKYYMAMTNSNHGIILYQLLMHYKDKPFKEFYVSMTDKQLAEERRTLIQEAKSFGNALRLNNPKLARNVLEDENLNWLCDRCQFLKQCQEWRG
jgi:CRISPR/Cas system-associated exonuclease Cas4 (RecB family)